MMNINHSYVSRDCFPAWKLVCAIALAFFCIFGAGVSRLDAGCIALDDVPLDVQQQQAPGIVMFLLDNSGSMDWEVLCPEYSGQFASGGTTYSYVFSDPGDNAYANYTGNGYVLEDSAAANKWKSQWHGYNHMYYNPTATYIPWPTQTNADLNTPRSNPVKPSPTLDLSHVWYDFGAPLISTTALQNAGAVFVDNLDTGASQGLAPEIIMDTESSVNDVAWAGQNYGLCTLTTNSTQPWASGTASTAYPKNTNAKYWYSSTATSARSKTYTATWSFTNITSGNYDVYVWWVANRANPTAAQYQINGVNAGTTKNQTQNGGTWNLLASNVALASSATVSVSQTNASTGRPKRLCADAVKIVPRFNAVPPVLFSKTGPVAGTDSGWVLNTDVNAYQRPQDTYPGTYFYTNAIGAFSATWTANHLNPNQLYDVYAIWAQGGSNRSSSVPYTTYNSGTPTVTNVDQTQTLGDWTKIAGGTNGVTFTGGIGTVVLNRTTTSASAGRACADAVAFVPHGTLDIQIHRAHYYIQTAGGTYLVDINGGSIVYYAFTDTNSDGIVQGSELTRLTDAQATTAGIKTSRTYTQERQNFANWYSFYRRRILTAKNAISNVMNTMNGVYIGIFTINNDIKQIALPVRVTINNVTQDQSGTLIAKLFTLNASGGTPLRIGLNNIGLYFKGQYAKPGTMPSTNFASNTYPFFIADQGGACQQAFTIVMTDGYWNDYFSGVGNADKNNDTNAGFQAGFNGPPYADTASDTLADVAMYYYEHDLNLTLNNNVPVNAKDSANFQHLVTYTMSFGLSGTVDQSAFATCPTGACPVWPTPVHDTATCVDDLWHAAVNGRGLYVNASNPMAMVNTMNALKQDIQSRLGSSASLATSSIQRQVGTNIYQAIYNTAGWSGEVYAKPIDVATGAVLPFVWAASGHVPVWGARKIFSYDGSQGIEFTFNNISPAQETQLANNSSDPLNPFDPAQIVDFIRGDTSNNLSNGGTLRIRTKILGDFIHSAPTYYKGVVYIGSNDGMLHAFDAATGVEKFCYVPAMVYDHLSDLAIPGYSHKYYVDGTPVVGAVNSKDILVCGLGKGGKGYFGLDVTTPDTMTAGKVLWEFPSTTDDDMGYAFSNATIVKTTAAGYVVVFGNGYDSVNQKAILYFVNPETGVLIKKLDTLTAGCNGLSSPQVVDVDGDGYADYAYAGDLLGNMWKFDLRGSSVDNWKVYYQNGSTPMPLVTVRNATATTYTQPITAAPEVMLDCVKSAFADKGAGLMVIFGTGRYLNASDLGDTSVQSFYGIWDWGDIWEQKSGGGATGYAVAKTKYLGTFDATRTLSNVSGKTLLQQTLSSTANAQYLVMSNTAMDWYNPEDTTGQPGIHMGWYFDLPGAGERGIQEPTLRMGVAVLVSTIPSSSPCEAGGSSVLYQVSACSGGQTLTPQFDVNGDLKINQADLIGGLPPTGEKFQAMLFAPIEIGNMLYLSDSQGGTQALQVPPNTVGMQYWRILQ